MSFSLFRVKDGYLEAVVLQLAYLSRKSAISDLIYTKVIETNHV